MTILAARDGRMISFINGSHLTSSITHTIGNDVDGDVAVAFLLLGSHTNIMDSKKKYS
jgi:hypothetical protein